MAATTPTPLTADLEHGLRRLKLASMRRVAPEMLVTAKTQRWTPEELLRALVEVEITARDASNTRLRSKQASFPTRQDGRAVRPGRQQHRAADLGLPHLAGVDQREGEPHPDRPGRHRQEPRPDRPRARRRRPGPAGPLLHRRRARRDPLPRPGRQQRREGHRDAAPARPDHLRRGRLRAAGQHRQPAAVPLRRRRLRTPQPRDRQPLAVRGMGPLPARPQHRRQPARPAPAPQQRRRHRRRELPHARGPRPVRRPPLEPLTTHARWGLSLATSGDRDLAIDSRSGQAGLARSAA